jgi:hypothetical protein
MLFLHSTAVAAGGGDHLSRDSSTPQTPTDAHVALIAKARGDAALVNGLLQSLATDSTKDANIQHQSRAVPPPLMTAAVPRPPPIGTVNTANVGPATPMESDEGRAFAGPHLFNVADNKQPPPAPINHAAGALSIARAQDLPVNASGLGTRWPYFIHFHKAGGTTLCHQARTVNGMNVPLRNCNLPGDGPRTLTNSLAGDGNRKLSCAARAQYMAKHCIHFFAAERWLDGELCPERFFYVTVLRDPIKRIESNCRYEYVQPADALRWLTAETYLPEETRIYIGTAAVDNFYIRTLCGPDVFHLPFGSITRAHLELAKSRLAAFEAVLILEEYEAGLLQLELLLGWKRPAKKDAHRSFGSGDTSIRFSDDQRGILTERNQLDLELYVFAKVLL